MSRTPIMRAMRLSATHSSPTTALTSTRPLTSTTPFHGQIQHQQRHTRPSTLTMTTPRTYATATTASAQPIGLPLNIPKWLSENSHLLQPPVNNYCVDNSSMTVMIVGGPNARTDYHINETPEWFYMYKGDMLLKTVSDTSTTPHTFKDIPIREGEIFLLPPNTPHNPVRFKDTVGIVIEQPRPEGSVDKLRWYCNGCKGVVHEKGFHCTDLGTQIKDAVQAFEGSERERTCESCGVVADVRPKVTEMPA